LRTLIVFVFGLNHGKLVHPVQRHFCFLHLQAGQSHHHGCLHEQASYLQYGYQFADFQRTGQYFHRAQTGNSQ